MKPAPFRYARPGTLEEALALLASARDEAKLLAGGQSLVPMLNMRLVRPAVLVDLNGIAGLDRIAPTPDGGVTVGALVRHAELCRSPLISERAPLLAEAARHVGHLAIRNRGTLGGSLAHADPAAELPAAIVALEARVTLRGPRGGRIIAAADLFRGLLSTALETDEILTEVHVPPQAAAWGFAEIARRPGDFALAGVAAVIALDASPPRRCAGARLIGFGLGNGPVPLALAEAQLAGAILDTETVTRAARAAREACTPPDDVHASSEYRRHLASVLAEDVLLQAIARLEGRR